MTELHIITREGETHTVAGQPGLSVMELIREAGVDELLAMCGGSCSCATCHVIVDARFVDRLPPMGEDENDLLDSSQYRNDRSRLSCQLSWEADLDGLTVQIAPED